MGEFRDIKKTSFFFDEKIGRVSPLARYLFLATLTIADDNGAFHAHPAYLKARFFCYDEDITQATVTQWVDELIGIGIIVPLIYCDESYLVIRDFTNYHKIDKRYPNVVIPEDVVVEALKSGDSASTSTEVEVEKQETQETPKIPQKITDSGTCSEIAQKNEVCPQKRANRPKKPSELLSGDLFADESLKEPFENWLRYKREKGQTYKPIGLRVCYKKLVALSGGDLQKATAIVEQSIANNYAGLFPLREEYVPPGRHATTELYKLLNYEEMCRDAEKNGRSTSDYAAIHVDGAKKPMWVTKTDKLRFNIPDKISRDGRLESG